MVITVIVIVMITIMIKTMAILIINIMILMMVIRIFVIVNNSLVWYNTLHLTFSLSVSNNMSIAL